jgi:alkylation response protein AidB-like acyl-CoA dehydrogenase
VTSTLGISWDHRALHEAARAFLQGRCPPAVPRAYLDDADDHLPPFWADMAGLGWFGIHLPEAVGGDGAGLPELAIVLEELGRVVAPGPFLPTVLAAAVIDRLGDDDQRRAWLPGLATGATPAAVAFGTTPGTLTGGSLTGRWPLVPGADLAQLVLVPARLADPAADDHAATATAARTATDDAAGAEPGSRAPDAGSAVGPGVAAGAPGDGQPGTAADDAAGGTRGEGGRLVWCVVERADLAVAARPSVDATRRLADVGADAIVLTPDRILGRAGDPGETDGSGGPAGTGGGDGELVERLAVRLLAAEAVGVAGWCVTTAAEHARVREQFGRPIGQFQAVKHRCADMLTASELARAATWDAARGDDPGADVAAAALAPEAALRAAEGCVQVLGGMGFTWEHDAHLYLKRALGLRSLLGPPTRWRAAAVDHARQGHRRRLTVDLPAEADAHRAEIRAFVAELQEHPKAEWRARLADAGYLAPHWPRPWGRGAGALEQLVIDDEFGTARVQRPHLQIAAWVLAPIIAHGTEAQRQRLVPPTLRGELSWCQLFSEPGAGSDLASLTTKAARADGGWLISGQKVWTTFAHQTDVGLCLARSGTSSSGDKHEGITCFVVDMKAEGVDIRPLRELTGMALFNEVFLTDVFVPDDDVVGQVGDGWRAARTTLGNERVSMSRGSSFGLGEEALLGLLAGESGDGGDGGADPVAQDEVGRLLVEAHALAVMGLRMTLRALEDSSSSAAEPGPEASVRKLLAAEHDQKVQEMGWSLLGRGGGATDEAAATWVGGYLANRCLTIAGGTSEIQRNVIAERLLGLPRDA